MMELGGVFAVLILTAPEKDFEKISQEAERLLQQIAPSIPGLLGGAALRGEANNELWLVSRWDSRESWAKSRWDEEAGRTLTDMIESAVSQDVKILKAIATFGGNAKRA